MGIDIGNNMGINMGNVFLGITMGNMFVGNDMGHIFKFFVASLRAAFGEKSWWKMTI